MWRVGNIILGRWIKVTTCKNVKKTACYKRELFATGILNISVNDFDDNKSTICSQVLVLTELVASEI